MCSSIFSGKNNKELTIPRVVVADFVLVYTVLRRDVACRMEGSRLRAGD